jgi:hypothetical protein
MTLILTDQHGPRDLGHVEIDQRAVPTALPVGTPRYFEAHTYTCSHCQVVVILNPERTRERYKCRGCNHHICDNCAAKRFAGAQCKTFMQTVDEVLELSERQLKSDSIILP